MKTLKLLIKTSFLNKINDFLCFDIIRVIFHLSCLFFQQTVGRAEQDCGAARGRE